MVKAPIFDVGSTDLAEIRRAGIEAYGRQPDVSISPIEQLCERLLTVVKMRLANPAEAAKETGNRGFAIFLLTSNLRKDRERLRAKREPLIDSGNIQLSDHLWIVSPAFNAAGKIDLTSTDMGAAFDELEALNLGSYEAIVIDFNAAQLRVYRRGVAVDEDVLKVDIKSDDLNNISLSELLEVFNRECLITPNCQTSSIKVWNDGQRYYPAEAAEKKVQELLFMFLRARLSGTHRIEQELSVRSGRVDIVVNKKVSFGVWLTLAAVELKVARSFSCNGKVAQPSFLLKHLQRGYRQIREYKRELEAAEGWLVLYDLRLPTSRHVDPFDAHRQQSLDENINLHMNSVYGTADDYRDAQAALPV